MTLFCGEEFVSDLRAPCCMAYCMPQVPNRLSVHLRSTLGSCLILSPAHWADVRKLQTWFPYLTNLVLFQDFLAPSISKMTASRACQCLPFVYFSTASPTLTHKIGLFFSISWISLTTLPCLSSSNQFC